jgi:endonuclease/exonuclease/phosphatase family metal-dependent hydrolase
MLPLIWLAVWLLPLGAGAEVLRVATFNVENYVDFASHSRALKSAESRAAVASSIVEIHPDVLALEEMGSTNALMELREALRRGGVDLGYWEFVQGYDTNVHVAVLSRFPIVVRAPHTNEGFLLSGRRLRVSRGFAEVEIQASPTYRFTLIAAHLKSRLASSLADQEEWRLQEAMILRESIDRRLANDPGAKLVVLGDLNDVKDSRAIRTVLGKGKAGLFDTRPAERNGGVLGVRGAPAMNSDGREENFSGAPVSHSQTREVTWTEYYAREDVYSRIDYIFVSHGMERDFLREETYVLKTVDWGVASDHRPLVAGFRLK